MRMMTLTLTCAALLAASTVSAQDEAARRSATELAARVPFEQGVKGAPYSAETVVEGTQVLADGNRINTRAMGRVYRDSEGRTRRESDRENAAMYAGGAAAVRRTTISIVDPVGGFSYSLDPENKIAWRTAIGVGGAIMGKLEARQVEQRKVDVERMAAGTLMPVPAEAPRARGAVEQEHVRAVEAGGRGVAIARVGPGGGRGETGPLEHKTLEGVAVEGRKTTTVIPAGQIGNEQPLTITSEEWRSPELNVLVMTRHTDPRTGESTYRLQNVVRAEPDRSLFMVPADYTVKDTGIRKMLEASRK